MKIHCLGGGPAGLYLSVLLKKSLPDSEITVFERNRSDDTFGWGVVFSDETLGNLEEADPETFRAITESFATWDAIDVHVGDRVIRSGGHGFCGLSRKRLLLLLQERARELGVVMRFETEVSDPEELRRDCDLLVAADGVNSLSRKLWADRFQPTIELGQCRYIWLGTHQKFDAFTFSFRPTEHGVFQLHAYQFDADTSTFIVECAEDTWKRAGLDQADEAKSIEVCERVFEKERGGHPLLGNRSSWIRFPRLHNEHWWFDNVVLLGDAAHTAHFSVGSGTKMAMEDAIVLAQALAQHPGDLSRALAAYEEERRPMIARIQRAAAQSRSWFEQTHRHVALPPERLVFSLLTRTRRVTHDNLRMRDPAYIESVDRWYADEQGVEPVDGVPVPAMLTPLSLRGLRLDNRVVVSSMCQYSAEDGTPGDWHLVHLGSRALGGAGLVMTEMTDVSAEGRISHGCTGLYKDEHVGAWSRIVDFVHDRSRARVGMQLGHAGRKASTRRMWEGDNQPLGEGGWETMAPSPVPWSVGSPVPREMTRADMVQVRDQYVRSARMAARCGFDLLELHMAHGYLLSSFITPVSNKRTDEYGGSAAGRARFPLEVVDAVREAWADRPLTVRISATDWVPGGFTVDDAVELSGMLKEHGVDAVDVSSGQTTPDAKPVYGRAYQMPFSERIRNEVGIPTITVGNIWSADQINTILIAGRADLVALARAHLVDPYLTLHAVAETGVAAPERWPVQYRTAEPMARRMAEPRSEPGSSGGPLRNRGGSK